MSERITFYRYVIHSQRADYEAAGWVFSAELRPTHGQYSILMEWPFAGDPVEPKSQMQGEAK